MASWPLADAPLIFSNYSGGGAATVVKSYHNLGLTQPLLVSYANVSDAFINLIRNDMPARLEAVLLRLEVKDTSAVPPTGSAGRRWRRRSGLRVPLPWGSGLYLLV